MYIVHVCVFNFLFFRLDIINFSSDHRLRHLSYVFVRPKVQTKLISIHRHYLLFLLNICSFGQSKSANVFTTIANPKTQQLDKEGKVNLWLISITKVKDT